jgi:hypothetical protein
MADGAEISGPLELSAEVVLTETPAKVIACITTVSHYSQGDAEPESFGTLFIWEIDRHVSEPMVELRLTNVAEQISP